MIRIMKRRCGLWTAGDSISRGFQPGSVFSDHFKVPDLKKGKSSNQCGNTASSSSSRGSPWHTSTFYTADSAPSLHTRPATWPQRARRKFTKAKVRTHMWAQQQLTAVTRWCSFTPPCYIYMCLDASRYTMRNPNGISPLVHLKPVLLGPRAVCSGLWRRHNLHSLLLAPCTRHTCLAAHSPSTQDVHYVMQHPTLEVSSEVNNYMYVMRNYRTKVHGVDARGWARIM